MATTVKRYTNDGNEVVVKNPYTNEEWLSQKDAAQNGGSGMYTWVNPNGSSTVVERRVYDGYAAANPNAKGESYAQGTIGGNNGGTYGVYDGAQNSLGLIYNDGSFDRRENDDSYNGTMQAAVDALRSYGVQFTGNGKSDYEAEKAARVSSSGTASGGARSWYPTNIINKVKAERSAYKIPEYSGQWEATRDALARLALEMNYDTWAQGDSYAALADRYRQQANNGMQDTLGQMAARTGGLASSYAGSAAQQQYNAYMGQLEAAARDMYAADRADALANAQLAGNLADADYNRYVDSRNFDYGVWGDALAQQNYENEFAYQQAQDALAQQNYENELAYQQYVDSLNRGTDTQSDARSRIDQFLGAGGRIANLDSSLIAASGYTQAELAALENYYSGQTAGGGGRYYGSGAGDQSGNDFSDVDRYVSIGGKSDDYLAANYKALGFSKPDDAKAAYKVYNTQKAAGYRYSAYNLGGGSSAVQDSGTGSMVLGKEAQGLNNRSNKDGDWITSVESAYSDGRISFNEYKYLLNQI